MKLDPKHPKDHIRVMRVTAIDEFPAIKKAVNDGIEAGLHRLHTETNDPTYIEAQDYVLGHIKAALDARRTKDPVS